VLRSLLCHMMMESRVRQGMMIETGFWTIDIGRKATTLGNITATWLIVFPTAVCDI
jgi:hypothetical protein